MPCRVCGEVSGGYHVAKEMMLGLRDEFDYFECANCGCLQIINPPEDMSPYYPPEYYSFAPLAPPPPLPRRFFRRWVFSRRNRAQIFGDTGFWNWVAAHRPRPDFAKFQAMLAPTAVRSFDARIADVGCGSGELLRRMAAAGFSSLTGIDPYLPTNIELSPGLTILAQPLDALSHERFDLIMFHHSLEHISAQVETLTNAARLLATEGVCLVRLPLAGSDPWQIYGTNWIELDAPRHFCLHTVRSFESAARQAGLEVYQRCYETNGFAYWGSEFYLRGLPFYDRERRSMRAPSSVFAPEEIQQFETKARSANARNAGSSAAFYLRRARTTSS
jgi:SAM-dependent methyltransferase